jgi:hypothetical protein
MKALTLNVGFDYFDFANWRKAPYGITTIQGYKHPVLIDRDYSPIAELPSVTQADLDQLHNTSAKRPADGAYFYDDSSSPRSFFKNGQAETAYFSKMDVLQKLKFVVPEQTAVDLTMP